MFDIREEKEIIIVKPNFNIEIEHLDELKELKEELQNYISDKEEPKVILNFENVSYVDSTGLGNIIRIFEIIRKKKGTLAAVNLNVDVEKIFNITTLDTLIKVYPTLEDAINDLRG